MNEYKKHKQSEEDLKDVFKQRVFYDESDSSSDTSICIPVLIVPPIISLIIFFIVSAEHTSEALPFSIIFTLLYVFSCLKFYKPGMFNKHSIMYSNVELSDFGRFLTKASALFTMVLSLFMSSGLYLLLK